MRSSRPDNGKKVKKSGGVLMFAAVIVTVISAAAMSVIHCDNIFIGIDKLAGKIVQELDEDRPPRDIETVLKGLRRRSLTYVPQGCSSSKEPGQDCIRKPSGEAFAYAYPAPHHPDGRQFYKAMEFSDSGRQDGGEIFFNFIC